MSKIEMANEIIRKYGFESKETIDFFTLLEENKGFFYDIELVTDMFEELIERALNEDEDF